MPGPDQWTPEDYQKASALFLSGRGSAQQRERLGAAIDAYKGQIPAEGGSALPKVSRETRSGVPDPFEAYDAESAAIGPAPEAAPIEEEPGLLETAGRSLFKGYSFGLSPEIAQAAETESYAATGDLMEAARRGEQAASATRDREGRGERANPKTALVAETAGAVMSPATKALGAFGGALGAAPGFAGKAGRAYELGMKGAFEGAGSAAALADEGMGGYDAAIGAGIGAAAGPLSAFLLDPVAGGAGRMASRRKALSGGPDAGDVGRLLDERGAGALEQLGNDMDQVGFGVHGSQGMLEKAEEIVGAARQEIQAIEQSGAAQIPVNLTPAGDVLYDQGAKLIATGDPSAVRMGRQLLEHSDGILQNPARSYSEALDLRRFLDDLAFDADGQKNGAMAKQLRKAVGQVRHAIISAAEQESPEFAERVLSANKAFETAERVRHYSAYQVGREAASGQTLAGPLVQVKNVAEQRANSVLAPTLRQLAAFTDVSGAGLALPWLNEGEQ